MLTASVQPARGSGPLAARLPQPSLGVRHVFPSGLGQQFSEAAFARDSSGGGLDSGRFSAGELANAPTGPSGAPSAAPAPGAPPLPPRFFPVLVVLEADAEAAVGTVAPAAATVACGHPAPGSGPLPGDAVHLQVTYATVAHSPSSDAPACLGGTRASAEWAPRVLKQKIRVGNKAYELREIFGIGALGRG